MMTSFLPRSLKMMALAAPIALLPVTGFVSASHAMITLEPRPAALYAADLTEAVAGAKKRPFPAGVPGIGGMACSLATLRGSSPASRAFQLTLPADQVARKHVLVVVTPERGLLELYSPYDGDTVEADDILLPSQALSWAKARTRHRFAVNTDDLDGLRRGRTTAEAIFLEPGRYRFALVNGIDAALLRANRARVQVTAACSVDWAPQVTRR